MTTQRPVYGNKVASGKLHWVGRIEVRCECDPANCDNDNEMSSFGLKFTRVDKAQTPITLSCALLCYWSSIAPTGWLPYRRLSTVLISTGHVISNLRIVFRSLSQWLTVRVHLIQPKLFRFFFNGNILIHKTSCHHIKMEHCAKWTMSDS